MPDKIKKVSAMEILDSRGNPTVQATIELSSGISASAAVPSGASTGRFEAHELRDNDPSRYGGKGVLQAVVNVEKIIAPELIGLSAFSQEKIDKLMIELDGTKNKSKLGANAILAISLALAKAGAKQQNMELYQYLRFLYDPKLKNYLLPTPVVNVINGGAHGATNINLQEFWIVPFKKETFAEKIRQASEIFHAMEDLFKAVGLDTDLGNEGGYSPDMESHRQAFELLMQSTQNAGYEPEEDTYFGIDAGASEFFNSASGKYELKLENKNFSNDELVSFYLDLMEIYPLRFLEDPLDQEDWEGWRDLTSDEFVRSHQVKIIGDDIFVTNIERLKKGIKMGVANTILIKPNQIGTLTETLKTVSFAREHNYGIIVSHRSGETSDTTIADLAVAVNADYIKTGSTARGERIAKYNRLLSIEQKLK
ncbi:MAG: phosphopyruvate hydratase [Patescibacteria group bacterium]|nr:phosphopyruvate hydratase [Patescibacteria group bacterium]